MTAPAPTTVSATDPPLDPAVLARIEAALLAFLEREQLPTNLRAACRHAVLSGGKRLRPVLVIESARAAWDAAAEGSPHDPMEAALPAAIAMEFVHAFSLVHDDLPALDNDVLRRGQPTCHVAFGEALAILAGDCLLALAPIAAAASGRHGTEIGHELMRATVRMINGQVYDTLRVFPDGLCAPEQLELVHHNKTGALLECSCRVGALAVGADDPTLRRLTEYGQAIGLMFQIVDDLIDATQTAEHAGKATGKDAAAGKLTYPGIHGIEGSRQQVERLRKVALGAIAPLGARADRLAALVQFLADRTR